MKIITESMQVCPEYDLRNISSPEEMLLFDIETTGLKKETTQVYLIGCAYLENGNWKMKQWLTESASDEELILQDFFDFASGFGTVVHFNGDGFDIPYLQYKSDYYCLGFNFGLIKSFDIYKKAKTAKKLLGLKSMSQRSIEEFLGIAREDEMNGGILIPYYLDYEITGSKRDEELLLLHNHDDILGMFRILPILSYADVIDGKFSFKGFEECMGTAIFSYRLECPVPVDVEAAAGNKNDCDISVFAGGDLLQINVPIIEGIGRIAIPDTENYYYLPAEDTVIHKDVAQFVDRKNRVKATKKNCFIKKQGRFIPQLRPLFEPEFLLDCDNKRTYFLLDGFKPENNISAMPVYALDTLHFLKDPGYLS